MMETHEPGYLLFREPLCYGRSAPVRDIGCQAQFGIGFD